MDYPFPRTERQAELIALADSLAGPFAARAESVDRDGSFPFQNFREMHEAGYLGLTIPRERGGLGATPLEYALAHERIGRACGSTALAANMHLSLIGRINETGMWPDEILDRVNEDIITNGALINSANSEPDLGSPSRGGMPTTTAQRTPRGWIINGRKRWASLAPALTYMLTLATIVDGDAPPRRGNFLVPASSAGVHVDKTWDNLGMRGTASDDVVFTDVEVPLDALVPVDGSPVPGDGLGWSAFGGAAVFLGIGQAARDAAIQFAQRAAAQRDGRADRRAANDPAPHRGDRARSAPGADAPLRHRRVVDRAASRAAREHVASGGGEVRRDERGHPRHGRGPPCGGIGRVGRHLAAAALLPRRAHRDRAASHRRRGADHDREGSARSRVHHGKPLSR